MPKTSARPHPQKEQIKQLYVFTQRASGGLYSDAGATSIHLPASNLKAAEKLAFKKRLRLDGKLIN